MKEIRLHGKGGQGAVMAADMLATAFVKERRYAAAFPMFGFERRGAPVVAFVRFDNRVIRERTQVYHPECLIVMDHRLVSSQPVFNGLKSGGILILNSTRLVDERFHENLTTVGVVDATRVGLEEIGASVTNTCMIGAFARTTGWLQLDSLLLSLNEFFTGDILEKNRRCVKRGFEEVQILKF